MAVIEPNLPAPFSAYVHVPFCLRRCGYCDFNTYTGSFGSGADRGSYAETVLKEIDFSKGTLRSESLQPLSSIFFGGGTPSLLPPEHIGMIIERLKQTFSLSTNAEVTLEANPDTVDLGYLEQIQKAGVNRISMGMQSAVPTVLKTLDRTHNPENVIQAASWSKQLGLSFSVDLIYGAPAETIEQWQKTLESAIALEPGHISAYSLILEPGTALYRKVEKNQLPAVQDDDMADKYELADQILTEAGYHWYELSNFARTKEDRSIHNQAYWNGAFWWGYGPGAHSYLDGVRWWNVKHPAKYRDLLLENQDPRAGQESLTLAQRNFEELMLRLRTAQGYVVSEALVEEPSVAGALADLVAQGYIREQKQAVGSKLVTLTLTGRLMADYVTRVLADVLIADEL